MKREPCLTAPMSALAALLSALLTCSVGSSEKLPTRGTFKGIYHKYRGGGASFAAFVVPKELTALFDPYDGKY